VEIEGTLTHGATVFDRRRHPESRANMDVAVDVNVEAVSECLYRALATAA
jgi:inosine-uridine nucleoside N-ribohydrolase